MMVFKASLVFRVPQALMVLLEQQGWMESPALMVVHQALMVPPELPAVALALLLLMPVSLTLLLVM